MPNASPTASDLALRAADGTVYPLAGVTVIGREADCQIVLEDSRVSRYHTRLTLRNNGSVLVEDLNSSNGTFINGLRLQTPRTLALGDELRLHDIALRLTSTRTDNSDATVLASTVLGRPDAAAPHDEAPAAQPEPQPAAAADADSTYLLKAEEIARLDEIAHREVHVLRPGAAGAGPGLVVLTAPIRGKVFPLQADAIVHHWTIGRGDDCDIRLIDRAVSSRHVRLLKQGSRWRVENLSHTNKLFINGRQVESCALQSGDHIRVGRTELQFKTDCGDTAQIPQPSRDILSSRWFLWGVSAFGAFAVLLMLLLVFGRGG